MRRFVRWTPVLAYRTLGPNLGAWLEILWRRPAQEASPDADRWATGVASCKSLPERPSTAGRCILAGPKILADRVEDLDDPHRPVAAAGGYFQVPMTSYDLATGKR